MKPIFSISLLFLTLLACRLGQLPLIASKPTSVPSATLALANFTTPMPTLQPVKTATATLSPISILTETATFVPPPTPSSIPTETPVPKAGLDTIDEAMSEPSPQTPTPVPAEPTSLPQVATPTPPLTPTADFVLRWVRLRTNQENSWDGTLGPGQCGSDHSIYVYVADAQENLLDGILIGDKYGNFEVPTGVDGAGEVRILVWSATMELAVIGHQDGVRYTSDFTPPLSTLDEQIPMDWLQQAGYCNSPEDCKWRVENNQLCRGHYSYDVAFQRTW